MTVSYRTPRLGAAHPNHSAPSLGSCFGLMTPFVRLSPNYFTSTIVPARDIAPPAGGTRVFSSLVRREPLKWLGVGVRPAELGPVSPHAVHDHRHSACHSDDRAFQPPVPRNLHAQALSHDHLIVRVSMMWAASNSSLRIIAS